MPRLLWAELALDHDERDALVGHFDGVSVPQLMGREAASYAGGRGRAAQVRAHGCGRRWSPARRAADDAESGPIGTSRRTWFGFARSLVDDHGPSPRALVAASADFGKASAGPSTSTATCSSTPT